MTYEITQSSLAPELKKHIYEAFGKHAIRCTGIDGLAQEPISFEIREAGKLIGCVVVQLFWGQLHIKFLLVEEPYRGRGIARRLMEHAFEFGKAQGCGFSFVETMNFQALDFYQKLGFKIDFVRPGYERKTRYYYLSKDLGKEESSEITIRLLTQSDIPILVARFAEHNWPKPPSIFEAYLAGQQKGDRLIWVAHIKDQLAGYGTLFWRSTYQPFRDRRIPEIMDLNVLPPFRKRGVGSILLGVAETAALAQSLTVGIGVGLYEGYGEAQKLYIKRGYMPDGRGVTYGYQPIAPGSAVMLDDELVLWLTKELKGGNYGK